MDTDCQISKNNLISNNPEQCQLTLVKIKDAIIGSNKQKGVLISEGFVPIILKLCCDKDAKWLIRMNSLTILGSLAKGSEDQVKILVKDYNVIEILISKILLQSNDNKMIELCLNTLRSIFEHPFATVNKYFSDVHSLSYLLSLSSPESSIQTQISVAYIMASLCQSYSDQMLLFRAGTLQILARMICSSNEFLQFPALRSLSCMCFANRTISDNICVTSYKGKSLPDILTFMMSRIFNPDIQLTSARCLTYIYRSGTLPSSDYRLVYKTLPCLARLCTDDYDQLIRASAAETLAYFIEMDSELQRIAAISNHLMNNLSHLIQLQQPLLKQASFRCFASLAANDEDIRKRIIETNGIVTTLIDSLNDTNSQVRLASVRCLHSLSRSVQQLRTTFQDYSVWKSLMTLMSNQPSNELLVVITSTICNLLLEFSPSKEPMLNSGIVDMLCILTENKNVSLRLNGIWAIMNMAFQADQHVKTKIICSLGTDRILNLMCDTDPRIVIKTLGLLRNLLSKSLHIDYIMSVHSKEVLKAVNMVLDSEHSADIKEQALCIVGNIAAGALERDYIMEDAFILVRLGEFLYHQDVKMQTGALYVLNNIVHRKDSLAKERYIRLTELDIIQSIMELNKRVNRNETCSADYVNGILKQIISQLKRISPDLGTVVQKL